MVRRNRGGTRRALRIGMVYAGAVLVLTVILVVLDLSGPYATRPGELQGLELFLAVAALLVVGSLLLALSPAPRSVVLRGDSLVVVGRWGTRRAFGAPGSFSHRVLREFPETRLSPDPVEVVRVTDLRGRSVTYEVERGLLTRDGPAN